MKQISRKHKIGKILLEHINNNLREYMLISIIFLVGVVLGITFINNANENTQTELTSYITNFTESIKSDTLVDKGALIRESIKKNIALGVVLWFVGSTVIGIPIIYGIVVYKGFCIGYTVSALIAVLGNKSGILFSILSIVFQNILFIPAIIAIAVSGIKVYKSIIKDKRRENIKTEIYRHTIFSLLITLIFILSSFIEVYISTNLLQVFIKYI